MPTPITISIPHALGRDEAHRRIEAGFTRILGQLPGGGRLCSQRWDGDRLTFSVAAVGQTVGGVIDVLDTAVTMEIELPSILGLVAGRLKGHLQTAGRLLLTRK